MIGPETKEQQNIQCSFISVMVFEVSLVLSEISVSSIWRVHALQRGRSQQLLFQAQSGIWLANSLRINVVRCGSSFKNLTRGIC